MRGLATLRHNEPFAEFGGGAEGCEGYAVLVCGEFGGAKTHDIEQGEYTPLGRGAKYLVDAGDGGLAKRADGVELLVVHRSPDVAFSSWRCRPWGSGVRRVRVLDETGGATHPTVP